MQVQTVARRDRHGQHRRKVLWIEVRVRPEQQPALAGFVVVEVGGAGIAIVGEAHHPPASALVGRQRSDVAVGQLLQIGQYIGEVRVERLNDLSLTEIPHREQVSGGATADQRLR